MPGISTAIREAIKPSPYSSPDSETFRLADRKGYFLKDKSGGTYIAKWWNGYSVLLDLTNPEAVAWFQAKMTRLVDECRVDGFKLDAGDADSYKALKNTTPNVPSELWARLGLSRYRLMPAN